MDEPKKLFLLDGMALVYRAHFAFASRPIISSSGFNTSALFGYANTLADLIRNWTPSHMAAAFDTEAPTERHRLFAEYKAHREEMPEDLSRSLPYVRQLTEAFGIPVLTCDGFEADDIIGTLACCADENGFQTYMVTPDKDFGQLVSARTFLYRPSRMGDSVEVLGVPEILKKWGVQKVEQVVDILALWGDTSDNIPGVPGIGEKTAQKLIADFGSVEELLKHASEVKGKVGERLVQYREQALLSKKLATIDCLAPICRDLEALRWKGFNEPALKALFVQFEFNSIGRRLFGDEFKAGRRAAEAEQPQGDLPLPCSAEDPKSPPAPAPAERPLKTLQDIPHDYRRVDTDSARAELVDLLLRQPAFCFDLETSHLDPKKASICGIAFCFELQRGYYVSLPQDDSETARILDQFRPVFGSESIEKVGHNLKFDLSVLRWHGVRVRGRFFDTLLAHSLIEPEMRHGMDYLAEVYLGYSPIPITSLIGERKDQQISMRDIALDQIKEYSVEDADVTWQLRSILEPLLKEKGQDRVFFEIECPLLPVLVEMEVEGIQLDRNALSEVATQLASEIARCETEVHAMAGSPFNLNSPKQLGDVLFEVLKLGDKPKKTKTGQYATSEPVLQSLAAKHEIVKRILDYRECSKLKSTYVDLLPEAVSSRTGRIHTTYSQLVTSTGRLVSQNPNLQNIPIRTELGREIRKAFVPRDPEFVLLSADYSQIELRIIAALSQDRGMLDAFEAEVDIHAATAAKVYGADLESVTPEMRRKAKMVNFGIIYGISAFGLSQRLGIPRQEAAAIIGQYFRQYPAIQKYLHDTIAFAREHGYVQTVTGRRRFIRDIRSANATHRSAAEREAINAPIQGSAADMIKIAMARIHQALEEHHLRSRMLLQVHDELVFDLLKAEEETVVALVVHQMKNALPLGVPIKVDTGIGRNWLEAH